MKRRRQVIRDTAQVSSMEEDRVTTISNKHGKKKIHLISNRGEAGIAGLLVFGGALAVAGFMAIGSFASNRKKAKGKSARPRHPPIPDAEPQQLLLDHGGMSQDDHETTQSLCSLLQDSTTEDRDAICCSSLWTSNKNISQITSSELLSTQTLILDEKIQQEGGPTCFHHQEIALSEDSHPESATSSNENEFAGECLESLLNNATFQAHMVDKVEPQDGLKSIEIETETEDNAIREDDDDDDDIMESDSVSESDEEDSSNATRSTSLDSNDDSVWPAELIEEPEHEWKGGITDIQSEAHGTAKTIIVSASAVFCDSHVCSNGDADDSDCAGNEGAMSVTPEEATLNEKARFSLVPNDLPSAQKHWVIPMLLLALLLLLVLLTHHPEESLYVLEDGSSSVIVP